MNKDYKKIIEKGYEVEIKEREEKVEACLVKVSTKQKIFSYSFCSKLSLSVLQNEIINANANNPHLSIALKILNAVPKF